VRCRFTFYRDLPPGQVAQFHLGEPMDVLETRGLDDFQEIQRRIKIGAAQYARRRGWGFHVSVNQVLKKVQVYRYA
jgi:hypothetical protein